MRLFVLGAVMVPAIASAQFVGSGKAPAPRTPSTYRPDARVVIAGADATDIRERIGDGRATGQLSRSEARDLRREARQIDTLRGRYAADGLSSAEARELQVRAAVLRDQVNTRRTQGFGNTHPRAH